MFFQKLKKLFLDPVRFFKEASKEKDYWTVLKFFVVTYLVAMLIQVLVSIPTLLSLPGLAIWVSFLTAIFVGVVYAFVGPFIISGIMHLGILIVGGRKGFFNTFKAATYGTLVVVGYGLVTSIITNLFLLLDLYGTAANIFIFFPILIGSIHMLITQSIGVSMFHLISRTRTFFGIILVPMVLFILWVILGIIFAAGLFGPVGFNG